MQAEVSKWAALYRRQIYWATPECDWNHKVCKQVQYNRSTWGWSL